MLTNQYEISKINLIFRDVPKSSECNEGLEEQQDINSNLIKRNMVIEEELNSEKKRYNEDGRLEVTVSPRSRSKILAGSKTKLPKDSTIYLLAPIVRGRKGEYKKEILNYKKRGFSKIKVDGKYINVDDFPNLNKKIKHDISIVVDRIILNSNTGNRLADSVETCLNLF